MENNKTLGQTLSLARQDLKMEIAQVASQLKVKKLDIEAIEKDDFEQLNKHIYLIGLVRAYGKILKIPKEVLEEKIIALPSMQDIRASKHKLINLEQDEKLSPSKDFVFNSLLLTILLFLILLALYNSYEKRTNLISNNNLVKELVKIEF